jgi:hypothetical protein
MLSDCNLFTLAVFITHRCGMLASAGGMAGIFVKQVQGLQGL